MKFININEAFYDIGEYVDCFYSFFIMDNNLYSVHRKHKLFSFDNWPKTEIKDISQIILTKYHNKNPEEVVSQEVLCNGNDPRVICDNKTAYVLSEGAINSGILYTLTILPERKKIVLKPGKDVKAGKNWQPTLIGNELYVIDSISPYQLNRINPETGLVSKVQQFEVDLSLKAIHDNYSMLRGGSNALYINKNIHGWGHATVKPYNHIPYIWEHNDKGVSICFIDFHNHFKKTGYNIVDPASFFEWDEEYFGLSLSCSQREWFHPQLFMNALVLIKKTDFFKRSIPPPAIKSKAASTFFHATELDSLIDSSRVNGGMFNEGKKGCLVCGPSKEIDLNKKWTVELCYSSTEKPSKLVGKFDIFLNIEGEGRRVAKCKLYGTDGKSTRVKLDFSLNYNVDKALIQTRVFTLRKRKVTAYFFFFFY